jgi:hypothetical protein
LGPFYGPLVAAVKGEREKVAVVSAGVVVVYVVPVNNH